MNVPAAVSNLLVLFGGYHALRILMTKSPTSTSKPRPEHFVTASSVKIQVDSAVNTMGRSDLPQDATLESARRQVDESNKAAVVLHPALAAIYGSPQTF
jgi:hypothetical protein